MKRTVESSISEKEEPVIRCSPMILWMVAILLSFVGLFGILGGFSLYHEYGIIGFTPGILFFFIGVLMWFESFTTRMLFAKDGVIVKYPKIFPFPGYFYSFKDLTKIKMRGKFISLKHKQMFFGSKRFFIFDFSVFIEEIEKYAPFKLDKS